MDGTRRRTLLESHTHQVSGVVGKLVNRLLSLIHCFIVDIPAKRVYWVDPKVDRVESVDYDGNDRQIVATGMNNVPHPFGVTLFDQYLYWTDWTRLGVLRVEKFGSPTKVLWCNFKQVFPIILIVFLGPTKRTTSFRWVLLPTIQWHNQGHNTVNASSKQFSIRVRMLTARECVLLVGFLLQISNSVFCCRKRCRWFWSRLPMCLSNWSKVGGRQTLCTCYWLLTVQVSILNFFYFAFSMFSSNKVVRGIFPNTLDPALSDAILPISPISQRRIGMCKWNVLMSKWK